MGAVMATSFSSTRRVSLPDRKKKKQPIDLHCSVMVLSISTVLLKNALGSAIKRLTSTRGAPVNVPKRAGPAAARQMKTAAARSVKAQSANIFLIVVPWLFFVFGPPDERARRRARSACHRRNSRAGRDSCERLEALRG